MYVTTPYFVEENITTPPFDVNAKVTPLNKEFL